MKLFLKIIWTLCISIFLLSSNVFALEITQGNQWWAGNIKVWNGDTGNKISNNALNDIKNTSTSGNFFEVGVSWEQGIKNLLINIARDAKNIFFIIATIIMFILVFRLLFADNSEEEAEKFKSGIIWTAIGIIVMQISFVFYKVMFDKWANALTATGLSETILEPFTKLLMTGASFLFIAIAIYAFYKLVTANGDDDAVSKGKMTIVYGILWFIVIKFANILVESTYGTVKCWNGWFFQVVPTNCIEQPEIEWVMGILTTLINWINGFLWIVIVLLIIYAWFLVMTGKGDEEKSSKAKNIIFYAFIGLLVLLMSYLLLTFFIIPESPIG